MATVDNVSSDVDDGDQRQRRPGMARMQQAGGQSYMSESRRKPDVKPAAMGVAEAAATTGLSETTIRRLERSGQLRSVRIGKRILFRVGDVAALLEPVAGDAA